MSLRWMTAGLFLGMLTACAPDSVSPATESTTAANPTNATTTPPSGEPSPSSRQSEPGTTVVAAGSDFGTFLFDATGQAIYIFDLEATTNRAAMEPAQMRGRRS